MSTADAGSLRRRVWRAFTLLALAGASLAEGSHASELRTPLTHLSQIGPALMGCWKPPANSEGSLVTLRFGLNAEGRLKGPPLATYSRLTGTAHDQRAFMAAALTALDQCTPLAMQPDLARVVASRVLTITFSAPARSIGI